MDDKPQLQAEAHRRMEAFRSILERKIAVCDIGASPIEDVPVYKPLYDRDMAKLVLFEPQPDMAQTLRGMINPDDVLHEVALGDGEVHELRLTVAAGMTSLFEPDPMVVNRFHGYPHWSEVKERLLLQTSRLDDLDMSPCDFMKLDTQGAELQILDNATASLTSVSVVHTEAYFLPVYQGIPLFADIDACMRRNGFFLHSLINPFIRMFSPLMINNSEHVGINQWVAADCVYVKGFDYLYALDEDQIKSCICMLTTAYNSIDLAYRIALEYDAVRGTNLGTWYGEDLLGLNIV